MRRLLGCSWISDSRIRLYLRNKAAMNLFTREIRADISCKSWRKLISPSDRRDDEASIIQGAWELWEQHLSKCLISLSLSWIRAAIMADSHLSFIQEVRPIFLSEVDLVCLRARLMKISVRMFHSIKMRPVWENCAWPFCCVPSRILTVATFLFILYSRTFGKLSAWSTTGMIPRIIFYNHHFCLPEHLVRFILDMWVSTWDYTKIRLFRLFICNITGRSRWWETQNWKECEAFLRWRFLHVLFNVISALNEAEICVCPSKKTDKDRHTLKSQ